MLTIAVIALPLAMVHEVGVVFSGGREPSWFTEISVYALCAIVLLGLPYVVVIAVPRLILRALFPRSVSSREADEIL